MRCADDGNIACNFQRKAKNLPASFMLYVRLRICGSKAMLCWDNVHWLGGIEESAIINTRAASRR